MKLFLPKLDERIEGLKKDLVKSFAKKFKLEKVLKYVEEPNELDNKSKEFESRLLKLENDSHPPIFSKKDKDAIIKRLKKLEAIDYDVYLRKGSDE